MLRPGTIIGDRYEIIDKIGAGGMSDVYKAKDHKLNRFVAVKVLKAEFSANKNFVSKFRVEAQSAAGLMHPNIVNVYDVGEEEGIHYFVMELVEGITLKNYIEKKMRLSVKEAISIAIQVSMGIEAAHNNNIIHRDIKPQNIIISKEGKVKVADFGIARAATSDTITSHAMGSVHYTSPEQARGGYSDAKSDIYSLGITMYEMLTGRVPFDGETTVSIAIKHIQEEIPSPRDFVAEIPVSVEQIIFKCTQKNPDRRYSNMSELIQDLKRSLINPDEDFVKMIPVAGSEGTKAITDADRMAIKKKSNDVYGQQTYNQQAYAPQGGYAQSFEPAAEVPYDSAYTANYEAGYDPYIKQPKEESARSRTNQRRENGYYEDNSDVRKKKPNKETTTKKSNKDRYYEDGDDDYGDDVDPKMEKVMTVLTIITAVIIGLLAIFLVGKVMGLFDATPSGEETAVEESVEDVTVPNVIGISITEAKNALNSLGLGVTEKYEASDKYGEDIVISQDIAADTKVAKNTSISLSVSLGADGTAVPSIVGKTEAEAKVAIEAEGFRMVKQTAENDTVAKGNVISQNPLGGANAASGSDITVIVSTGASSADVVVPDLLGKDETSAKALLTAAGLTWTTIEEENNDTVLAGLVASQSYAAGMTVVEGTSVDFVLSLGPEGYSCNYSISAPGDYGAGSEAIVILTNSLGVEIARYTTSSFPFALNQSGIVGSTSGSITLTYLKTDGQWATTSPVAVTFTKE